MQSRMLTAADMEQVKSLWDYCFEKRQHPFFFWYFDRYCQSGNILGVFDKQTLAGMLHLNPYNICLNNKSINTSYIVGVATAPGSRRQGVMRGALRAGLEEMEKRGQPVAVLMPAAAGIYTPYGFAFCYNKLRYKLPLVELAQMSNADISGCRLYTDDDTTPLREVYSAAVRDANGFFCRGGKEWRHLLAEHRVEGGYAALYQPSGKCRGYMLYSLDNNVFRVLELLAMDEEAKMALLAYAGQHATACEEFFWQAPADDLTYLRFAHNKYYPVLYPFMMGRIVNATAAVDKLQIPFIGEQSVKIDLIDSLMASNNGIFELTGKNDRAVLRASGGQPKLSMNIGAFAQLCFSAYSVRQLKAAGYIRVYDDSALDIFERVFAVKNNYINEYF